MCAYTRYIYMCTYIRAASDPPPVHDVAPPPPHTKHAFRCSQGQQLFVLESRCGDRAKFNTSLTGSTNTCSTSCRVSPIQSKITRPSNDNDRKLYLLNQLQFEWPYQGKVTF